jgi:hypothetical protein
MLSEESHLSDQELLLAADGELSARDAARVEAHLEACWSCRARQEELEASIGDFVRAYRGELDPRIPAADGPRALLKARIMKAQPVGNDRMPWISGARLALAAAALAVVAIAGLIALRWAARPNPYTIAVMVPNPSLTPGATVLLGRGDVCRESNANNKAVPVALRRRVFDEYGIHSAAPDAYEVDYLITPALGGADDIHNLWPQAYRAAVWNAQVKDALEDHLRDLVCDGQLDLATAQREIATNWIEAYKKYFHTDQPLTRFR